MLDISPYTTICKHTCILQRLYSKTTLHIMCSLIFSSISATLSLYFKVSPQIVQADPSWNFFLQMHKVLFSHSLFKYRISLEQSKTCIGNLYFEPKAKKSVQFWFFCVLEIGKINHKSNWRKYMYSSTSLNIILLINLCSLGYHDLRVFLEGELLLGRALLSVEIRYKMFHWLHPSVLCTDLHCCQHTQSDWRSLPKDWILKHMQINTLTLYQMAVFSFFYWTKLKAFADDNKCVWKNCNLFWEG